MARLNRTNGKVLGEILLAMIAALMLWIPAAHAQTTVQYVNSSTGSINDLSCGTANVLMRTFSVTNNLLITDVNLGILLDHSYRGDLQITLTSPAGTTVTLMNNIANSGRNLNDLFDDSASLQIESHTQINDNTISSLYPHSSRPTGLLSSFNGQLMQGTWTLRICDSVSLDVGTFYRSDLFLTGVNYADLSLAMTRSSSAPTYGTTFTYTLTASSAATSSASATGVTVSDVLPSGASFVSASGTGTYNSATGTWSVGSLAAGATASLTITASASAPVGSTVTNTAQITASSQPDPDSTVNNGVTSEDDYASASIVVGANSISCPTGSAATGSGYATGTDTYANQIFWFDWSCGGTALFNKGSTVTKSWDAGDGLVISATLSAITADLAPYSAGSWFGDMLDNLYPGVNPIGLRNYTDGEDPQFSLALSAALNGTPVSLRYVLADAESTDASNESINATTTGSAWQLVESAGVITVSNSGGSFTFSDLANAGSGTAILESSGTNPVFAVSLQAGGVESVAAGILTPFDYSDAPLTGTSYGAASHRTISGLHMGSAFTTENSAFDSPTASADSDDAVALPNLFRAVAASISVPVAGPGKLSVWIDYDDDGDFADAGEQVATSIGDGGAGDGDGAANGTIVVALTPPANAAATPTIARFRFSSSSGAASSGQAGFGEVEDYALSIIYPLLSVSKSSSLVSDPTNGLVNPKAIPGAVMRYCVLTTNGGSASASSIVMVDSLPVAAGYVAGSLRSGSSCSDASTIEDDNSSGADEADPLGASYSGTTISANAASLAVGASIAIRYDVVVQ